VGIEKLHVLPWQLDGETARLLHGIKDLFDPNGILNPGKGLPDPAAEFAPSPPVPLETLFRWDDLTVTAPAGIALTDLQAEAMARGLQIPVGQGLVTGVTGPTVGQLVDHLVTGPVFGSAGTARDCLLEIWAETGEGRPFHAGAPVFKNVAGFDLVGLAAGSGGTMISLKAATFMLRPVPRDLGWWRVDPGPDIPLTALDALLETLGNRDTSLGGPTVLYETDGVNLTGPVHLLVPGRARDWDLESLASEIKDTLGCMVAASNLVPFGQGPDLLDQSDLPRWCRRSGDWTLLARRPGAADEWSPGIPGCFVWQSAPRLVWASGHEVAPDGWRADPFRDGAGLSPVPPLFPGQPLDLVRGLKNLFDPAGHLAGFDVEGQGGDDD